MAPNEFEDTELQEDELKILKLLSKIFFCRKLHKGKLPTRYNINNNNITHSIFFMLALSSLTSEKAATCGMLTFH